MRSIRQSVLLDPIWRSPRSEHMWRMIPGVRAPLAVLVVATVAFPAATPAPPDQASPAPAANPATAVEKAITAAECTAEKLGTSVAATAIGEPVRAVTLSAPTWNDAAGAVPAHCR